MIPTDGEIHAVCAYVSRGKGKGSNEARAGEEGGGGGAAEKERGSSKQLSRLTRRRGTNIGRCRGGIKEHNQMSAAA